MAGSKIYNVKEIFLTIQGEGYFLGTPSIFIRFVGCNIWSGYEADRKKDSDRTAAYCPLFCDTDFTKENSLKLTLKELLEKVAVLKGNAKHCVLTGGEPMLSVDKDLILGLKKLELFIAIETNGTVSLEKTFGTDKSSYPDWITCSPKILDPDKLVVEEIDEIKLVVPQYKISEAKFLLSRVNSKYGIKQLWLQPEDGSNIDNAKNFAVKESLKNPSWRVGIQAHKFWNVS